MFMGNISAYESASKVWTDLKRWSYNYIFIASWELSVIFSLMAALVVIELKQKAG